MTYAQERSYYLTRLDMVDDSAYSLADLITKLNWARLNFLIGSPGGGGLDASTIEQMIGADLSQHVIDFSHLGSHSDGSHTGANKVAVQKNGVLVATRPTVNFVETANLTLSIVDDVANNRVIVTPSASAGGVQVPDVKSEIVGFAGRVSLNKTSDFIYFEKNATIQAIILTGTPPDVGTGYLEIDVIKSGRSVAASIMGLKPRFYVGMQNPSIVSIIPLSVTINQGERLQVKVIATGGTGTEAQDISVEVQYIEADAGFFTSFQNTGNSATALDTIVTSGNNASPDSWDTATITGTATLTFDATYAYKGINKVYKAVSPAGAGADVYLAKNITATSRFYFTQTFVLPSLPTVNITRILRGDVSAGSPAFSISVGLTGLITIRDLAGTTLLIGAVAITAGQAFRIDGIWQGGPDGFVELYITTDTTSIIPSEHLYVASANIGATLSIFNVGRLATGASSTAQTVFFMGTMASFNGISGTAA